jgi:hypothetical protein
MAVPPEVVPHHVTIETYGVEVHVRASSAELLARVEPLFPPGYKRTADNSAIQWLCILQEEDGTYAVYQGANRACGNSTDLLALVVFRDQLESYVAVNAPDLIFVHAGVVARDDRAFVFPGNSFAGKSTLVEALVRRGAAYYSDEFAVIDSEGLVQPYATPLALRHLQVNGDALGERSAESLGGTAGTARVPIGLAVVTYYAPGSSWNPRRLSRGEAALALLANAVPARYRSAEALQYLSRAVDGATVLEGERGEADEFADMLLDGAVV